SRGRLAGARSPRRPDRVVARRPSDRGVRWRCGACAALPSALRAPPCARLRAVALSCPLVRRRECRRLRLLRRLLRAAPLQRALPDERLALLGLACRRVADTGADHGRTLRTRRRPPLR